MSRLQSLTTRNSAAYKGVYALILKEGCVDWHFSNRSIDHALVEEHQVDIHHIFPQAYCEKCGIGPAGRRGIVNKTPLSMRASRSIGTHGPDTYLRVLERESGMPQEWLEDVIKTHLVEPQHLRSTDFDAFFASRSGAILDLIEAAMGKEAFRVRQDSAAASEGLEQYQDAPEEPDSALSEI